MIDMAADAEWQIELLRLQPLDLATDELAELQIIVAGRPEQLGLALVATEHRVRLVEEDDRGFREIREALVLDPAARHEVAGRGGVDDLVGHDGALRRQLVDDGLAG